MLPLKYLLSIFLWLAIAAFSQGNSPDIEVFTSPVSCNGKQDGSIKLVLKNFSNNSSLRIIKKISKDTTWKSIPPNGILQIPNQPAGMQQIELVSNSTVEFSTNAFIFEPEPLSGNKIEILKTPTSAGNCDGALRINPTGGNKPYSFLWSQNTGSATSQSISDLCYGIYRCAVNDSLNCGPVYVSVPLIKTTANQNQNQNESE